MKCECCGQEVRETTTARFDDFWKVYPSKVDKTPAFKVWKRRKLDAIADKIIEAVRNRAENDPRWQSGYIMSPRRFLLNDNWDDEFDSAPRVVNWPKDNNGWLELGGKHRLSPNIGEGWPQFKERVRRTVGSV